MMINLFEFVKKLSFLFILIGFKISYEIFEFFFVIFKFEIF